MEVVYADSRIEKFLKRADKKLAARVARTIDLLEICGNKIELPHSKSIGRGLFELRTEGNTQVRIIFMFHKDKAYLLHIFMKKAQKIKKVDIEAALRVKEYVLA